MNYKLPILASAFGLAVIVQVASTYPSQTAENKGVAETGSGQAEGLVADRTISPRNGQELVAEAVERRLWPPGLEAKTRQSVHVFNQKLVGSGSYSQLANGPKLFLKLELKLRVDDEDRSLLQISDGDSLWEVHGRDDVQTLSHVSLGRLREVAAKGLKQDPPLRLPPSLWMALGGIPRLLAELEKNFVFQDAQPMTVAGHPVWKLEGQWKPAMLANMLPEQKEEILAGQEARLEELPPQVPHGVTLILGRDEIIPLFPYSFSFYRNVVVDQEAGAVERDALVTWELFEVRIRPDLRSSDFDHRPAPNQEVHERTGHYVKRLQAAAEKLAK